MFLGQIHLKPKILITRPVSIPDTLRVSRYQKAPELGPRILFFSGGSALNGVARQLKKFTHNSIHLVTPFDSGGSSAVIRDFFDMPAVGDIRSRLMALADETILGHPDINALFEYRFCKTATNDELLTRLKAMIACTDALTKDIANPMQSIIANHLGYFLEAMPREFDLRGASIGNLILVGGYLNQGRRLDPSIFLFSELINAKGIVRAITEDNYHLVAELADGTRVIGQHQMTGKERPPISSPIKKLKLSKDKESLQPVRTALKPHNKKLIGQAELICYPPGSFYTSLAANLLPYGVAQAIASNPAPKVYIPNRGHDPEQHGMSLSDQIEILISRLQGQLPNPVDPSKLLNFVLIDDKDVIKDAQINEDELNAMGIQIIRTRLTNQMYDPIYDSEKLVEAIISLV